MSDATAPQGPAVEGQPESAGNPLWLYASVAAVATCGIVYELLIGAASSQLLGDAITQYSLTIGLYLSAMGLGSWLSQHLERRLFGWFLGTELGVGALGGFSVLLLFWVYANAPDAYPFAQYGLTLALGSLVGLEVPVLMRLLESKAELRYNAAYVLSLDYLGGLVGSVAFPLALLPWLGLVRTALLMGLLNVAVALLGAWRYRPGFFKRRPVFGLVSAALGLGLGACMVQAQSLEAMMEESLYRDTIVVAQQTPYQRIVLTRSGTELRLYLNGNLQYASSDEHRYHEALVQVPVAFLGAAPREVLVLGGGDGLAARELLKHPGVKRVDLVDLDAKNDRTAPPAPLAGGLERRGFERPSGSPASRGRLEAPGGLEGPGGPHCGGFTGPQRGGFGETLLAGVFPAGRQQAASPWGFGGAGQFALLRARGLLVRGQDGGGRGLDGAPLPPGRAQLRRLGLCVGLAEGFAPTGASFGRAHAAPEGGFGARAFRLWARRRRRGLRLFAGEHGGPAQPFALLPIGLGCRALKGPSLGACQASVLMEAPQGFRYGPLGGGIRWRHAWP